MGSTVSESLLAAIADPSNLPTDFLGMDATVTEMLGEIVSCNAAYSEMKRGQSCMCRAEHVQMKRELSDSWNLHCTV